ncbi:MAG: gliding motility-associated C-terminal domain-containing protein, partial [Bacteroidota bacterium]
SLFLAGAYQTTAGNYVDTLTTVSGCDSIITTQLSLYPEYVRTFTTNICPGDSLFLAGAYQTLAGTYTDSLTSINGCDSVILTTLELFPIYADVYEAVICSGESTYAAGALRTEAGTYIDSLLTMDGCDSVIITNVIVLPVYADTLFADICEGEELFVGGAFQSTAGYYADTLNSTVGCDSIIVTNLVVNPVYDHQDTARICNGDSLFLAGAYQNQTGWYTDNWTSVEGCDSVVMTHLIVAPTYLQDVARSICDNDSLLLAGAYQNTAGVYVDSLQSVAGCDSIIVTTLDVWPTYRDTFAYAVCPGDGVFAEGGLQTTTGIYVDFYQTTNGCDSVIVTDLTVLSTCTDSVAIAICASDSFFVAGAYQNVPGVYRDTFLNSDNLDSIIVTRLTVHPVFAIDLTAEICGGDSILLAGAYQTTAGVYADSLMTVEGCDSILLTTLTVHPVYQVDLSASICAGDSLLLGGAFQGTDGIYYDTLSSSLGCDSILATTLTILPTDSTFLSVEICASDSLFLAGGYQNTSGSYRDTLTNMHGCDSVLVTELIVQPTYLIDSLVAICAGDSHLAGGAEQTESGTYFDVYQTVAGCDSTIRTILTVHPTYEQNLPVTLCEGDSLLIAGEYVSSAGTYPDSLQSVFGCDSIVLWQVSITPIYVTNVTAEICEGERYFINGVFESTAGTYYDTLLTSNGCYNVVVTNLIVHPVYRDTLLTTICTGDSLLIGDTYVRGAGYYSQSFQTVADCDSTVVTELVLLPTYRDTVDVEICIGESYVAGGAEQTTTGYYTDVYQTEAGCDSIWVTNLLVVPQLNTLLTTNICEGDSLFLAGAYQTISGNYVDTLTAQSGCDSLVLTQLTVRRHSVEEQEIRICEGDSLLLAGAYQTESGLYTDSLQSIFGCDSVVHTTLVVEDTVQIYVEDQTICLGDAVQLFTEGATEVYWSPGVGLSCVECPNPVASPRATTTYTVSAFSCLGTVVQTTVTVEVVSPPAANILAEDIRVLQGDSLLLEVFTDQPEAMMTWSMDGEVICEDCTEIAVSPLLTTTYEVLLENEYGCTSRSEYIVRVDDACANAQFDIPNILSPNGDGFNDEFVIRYEGLRNVSMLRIYNRWGEMVYQTPDVEVFWDGTFRGQALNPGVYVYYLEGTCLDGEPFTKTGNVTIIK